MESTSLFNNPAFTGFLGTLIGVIGGFIGNVISQLIIWKKDVAILQQKSRLEYLQTATNALKDFLQKAVINIADINESHEEHAQRVRGVFEKELENNPPKTMAEWANCFENMSVIYSTYISTRHFLSECDRKFLDATHKSTVKLVATAINNKSQANYIAAISEFRVFCGSLYLALIKNLESISDQFGL